MNTFIRLSDELEMTEQDIDPLCTVPSPNFRPSLDLYVTVRQWAKPDFDHTTQKVVKSSPALVEGIWTQQWSVVELDAEELEALMPPPVTTAQVKTEAGRRILAIAPEWKQRNLTAQAAVLAKIGEANWTTAQAAEWDAGDAIWATLQAIRTASDAIELLDPIPQDYATDESLWA